MGQCLGLCNQLEEADAVIEACQHVVTEVAADPALASSKFLLIPFYKLFSASRIHRRHQKRRHDAVRLRLFLEELDAAWLALDLLACYSGI